MSGSEFRRVTLVRVTALALLGVGLAACDLSGQNPSGTAVLPEETTRISARAARKEQLATGSYKDDLPELTGAPGPDGRWPVKVGTGQTIYRDDSSLEVGSEGPYATTGNPSGS